MASDSSRRPLLAGFNNTGRIWLLVTLFCGGLFLVSLFSIAFAGSQSRSVLLLSATVQDLLAFILPPVLLAWLTTQHPTQWLGLRAKVSFRPFLGVIVIYASSLPFLNWLVEWNQNLTLPHWAAPLEQTLRQLEDQSAHITEILLAGTSPSTLLSGILVVGILAGFSEELFFRAGLQKLIMRRHPWLGITIAAFVFSLLHFQFYGFIPRMLLGIWFGYLYWRTGSLWPGIFAHALNNSIAVASAWCISHGWLTTAQVNIGVGEYSFPGLPAASLLLTAAILLILNKSLFFRKNG